MSESKQSLIKLEEHKEQYIKMLNTKIDTVKNRMEYEEKEISKQLQVISDELMKLNDIRCKVDSGCKDKDIKRRADMIDTIENNTRNVFDKRCIFMYYKCKDAVNDKLLMRKASPKLISNFVTTESSKTATSSFAQASVPKSVSPVASSNITTPKPTGVRSESPEVVIVGTNSPSLQGVRKQVGVSTESSEVVVVGITSPTQPSVTTPKRSLFGTPKVPRVGTPSPKPSVAAVKRGAVGVESPKVATVGTPSPRPSVAAMKRCNVGKELHTVTSISGSPSPGPSGTIPKSTGVRKESQNKTLIDCADSPKPNLSKPKPAGENSEAPKKITIWTKSPRPNMATPKGARVSSEPFERATAGATSPRPAPSVTTSFQSGVATSKPMNNTHSECRWFLTPRDTIANRPSSLESSAASSCTFKKTYPKPNFTSSELAAFKRESPTFGGVMPKGTGRMTSLVSSTKSVTDGTTKSTKSSEILLASFPSTSKNTVTSNPFASTPKPTIPKTITSQGVSPKSAPESSPSPRRRVTTGASPVSAATPTTQLVTKFPTCGETTLFINVHLVAFTKKLR